MAHISIDLPTITNSQKKRLILEMQTLLSEIADIDISEISVSLHELPVENMNGTISYNEVKKDIKEKERPKQEEKKKSFFKEMFP